MKVRSVTSNTAPSRLEAVSSGPKSRNELGVAGHHVAQEGAQDAGGLRRAGAGPGHLHGVVAEVRQGEVLEEQAAVGVRVGAHAPVAPGRQGRQLRDEGAVGVEELLGPVAAQPRLEQGQVLGVRAHLGHGHLVRSEACPPWAGRRRSFGPVQPLGVRRTIIGQRGRSVERPSRAARWMAAISSMTVSIVAAMAWCTVGGSSPATM